MSRPGFSTHEVGRRTGASYRQLDYWVRLGLVTPAVTAKGSGTYRRWSVDDLTTVRRLVSLLDEGYTLKGAARKLESVS